MHITLFTAPLSSFIYPPTHLLSEYSANIQQALQRMDNVGLFCAKIALNIVKLLRDHYVPQLFLY